MKRLLKILLILSIPASVFAQGDYGHRISPDGTQVIFVRHAKPCPITPNTGWVSGDYDEIWAMDVDENNERCIIKNNYSPNQDMSYYLGSFDSLYFSPDGKKVYFICQNCTTDGILYIANTNGSGIRRLSNAHQLDMVGGKTGDEYYGYLVAGVRKSAGINPIRWTMVLFDPKGNEIKEIDNIEEFWKRHKKM